MIGLITDEMLDVDRRQRHAGRRSAAPLRARNDFADRTSLVLYNETEPEAVTDIVRDLRTAPGAAG